MPAGRGAAALFAVVRVLMARRLLMCDVSNNVASAYRDVTPSGGEGSVGSSAGLVETSMDTESNAARNGAPNGNGNGAAADAVVVEDLAAVDNGADAPADGEWFRGIDSAAVKALLALLMAPRQHSGRRYLTLAKIADMLEHFPPSVVAAAARAGVCTVRTAPRRVVPHPARFRSWLARVLAYSGVVFLPERRYTRRADSDDDDDAPVIISKRVVPRPATVCYTDYLVRTGRAGKSRDGSRGRGREGERGLP